MHLLMVLSTWKHQSAFRTCQFEKCGIRLCSACSRDERLASARRPIQEHSFWRPDAQSFEALCVCDWQHYSFHKLLDLLVQATHITVVFCWLLIHLSRQCSAWLLINEGKFEQLIDRLAGSQLQSKTYSSCSQTVEQQLVWLVPSTDGFSEAPHWLFPEGQIPPGVLPPWP